MSWWDGYGTSQRIAVKGGIKAQNVHGSRWWGKRWIETLDSYGLGARLGRGRTYARQGQVVSIDVGAGRVKARVQGSQRKPYEVSVEVGTLSPADLARVREEIRRQPLLAAKLLAGEMPAEIESMFSAAGLSLFPKTSDDLETDCSCPDWSNPCKHVAAVFIILGEEFDRDPFLLFRLRGLERSELLKGLEATTPTGVDAAPLREPLPVEAVAYWHGSGLRDGPAALYGEIRRPPVTAALLKRLGRFPFWRGEESPVDALASVYDSASSGAIDSFMGSSREEPAPPEPGP